MDLRKYVRGQQLKTSLTQEREQSPKSRKRRDKLKEERAKTHSNHADKN